MKMNINLGGGALPTYLPQATNGAGFRDIGMPVGKPVGGHMFPAYGRARERDLAGAADEAPCRASGKTSRLPHHPAERVYPGARLPCHPSEQALRHADRLVAMSPPHCRLGQGTPWLMDRTSSICGATAGAVATSGMPARGWAWERGRAEVYRKSPALPTWPTMPLGRDIACGRIPPTRYGSATGLHSGTSAWHAGCVGHPCQCRRQRE